MDKTPPRDLTLKQRKWLSKYLECGNATEAALYAYDTTDRETAASIGWENLRKLDYTDFLEEAGITDKLLQQKILEGLEATRTVSAKIINKEADSQTDDFIDVPDFLTRHKYLETALKLKQRLLTKVDITTLGKELPRPIYDSKSTE
jgi:phage terminase small subunit